MKLPIDTKITFVIILLIIVFLFFVFHHYNNSFTPKETFTTNCNNIGEMVLNQPMRLPNTNLEKYSTWNNSSRLQTGSGDLKRDDGSVVKWKDLPWIVPDGLSEQEKLKMISNKNGDFTISFWIYLHEQIHNWQHVFRVYDYSTDRTPGVWLWAHKQTGLHIRQRTNCDNNDGVHGDWASEIKKNSIPLQRPVHCFIAFGEKEWRFYVNGSMQHYYSYNEKQEHCIREPVKNLDRAFIQVGYSERENNYLLKDFHIYNHALTGEQIHCIYNSVKNLGSVEDVRKKLGLEGFSNMDKNPIKNGFELIEKWWNRSSTSTYEGFVAQLPSEAFDFYSEVMQEYLPFSEETGDLEPPTDGVENVEITRESYNQSTPSIVLNKNEFNLPADKKLYYRTFDESKREFINLKNDISFDREKGTTFTMWFNAEDTNVVWPRLFDFGNGPNKDNIILAIYDRSLHFYVHTLTGTSYEWMVIRNVAYGQWYHLAWVIGPVEDSGKSKWNLYLNGYPYGNTLENKGYPESKMLVKTEDKNSNAANLYVQAYLHYGYQAEYDISKTKSLKPDPNTGTLEIPDVLSSDINMRGGISSLKIPHGLKVTLYSSPNFGGSYQTITGRMPDPTNPNGGTDIFGLGMGGLQWNDRTRSLKIEYLNKPSAGVMKPLERTNRYIGRSNWYTLYESRGYEHDRFYQGAIGDFRIYKEALSNEQIREIYENPKQLEG